MKGTIPIALGYTYWRLRNREDHRRIEQGMASFHERMMVIFDDFEARWTETLQGFERDIENKIAELEQTLISIRQERKEAGL